VVESTSWDDSELPDNYRLLRRIAQSYLVESEGDVYATWEAFKYDHDQKDPRVVGHEGCSCSCLGLISEDPPHVSVPVKRDTPLAGIVTVELVRRPLPDSDVQEAGVVTDPEPDNPSHCLMRLRNGVYNKRQWRKIAARLADYSILTQEINL